MSGRERVVEVDSDLYHGLKRLSKSPEFKHICDMFDKESDVLMTQMMDPKTPDSATIALKKVLNAFKTVHPDVLVSREIRNLESKAIKRDRKAREND